MKRCPTCQRTFADETQKFCANDGTPLVADEAPAFDPEATVMSSVRPLMDEEDPSQPSPEPLPPTQYFVPGSEPAPPPEQDIHQSYPPQSTPGATPPPSWSPTPQPPQQQQPYYPQQGTPGGQGAPQWQPGGQPPPQQPPWMPPPGGQPQGQNWGGAYNQPGQYAPYGATPAVAGGSSKVATASLICGIISFIAIAALFIIIGARWRDLRDLIEPLGWLSLGTGLAAIVCGVIGLIITKTTASRIKAGVGIFLGIVPVLLFLIGMARRF